MPAAEKPRINGENAVGAPPSVYVREQVERFLSGLWKELLSVERVSVDDDFFDLGGDSLIGVQLFTAIKKEYGKEFGLSVLFDVRTIHHLAECICKANQTEMPLSEEASLLVPLQPRGTRPPLFWIPGGLGNSVLEFKQISVLLGDDQPVYGFEVEPPEDSVELDPIEQRAARLIKALRAVQTRGPYRLMGFCGGGLVAFEMAQQLSALAEQVQFLGVVDCVDPQRFRDWKQTLRFNSQRAIWRAGQFFSRGPVGCIRQVLYRVKLFGKNLFSNVVGLKDRWTGTPLPITSQDIEEAVNKKALRNARLYFPKPYRGSCVVFVGAHTYHYCGLSDDTDPRLIWCRLSQGDNQVKRIPGDHLTMLREPNVFEFAKQLKPFL